MSESEVLYGDRWKEHWFTKVNRMDSEEAWGFKFEYLKFEMCVAKLH